MAENLRKRNSIFHSLSKKKRKKNFLSLLDFRDFYNFIYSASTIPYHLFAEAEGKYWNM